MSTSFRDVQDFLSNRRLALVGASLNPKDFSRALMRELSAAGYDIVPVNHRAGADTMIEGRRVHASVGAIAAAEAPVDGAILMVPRSAAVGAVRECLAAGVSRLWFHRGAGPGAVDPEAVGVARAASALVVEGECPLMFLPGAAFVHRVHGGMTKRWVGKGLLAPRPGLGLVVVLAILQALVGFPALGGGGLLIADPSGGEIGLPVAWLASSPFADYLVPGVLLFVLGLCHVAGHHPHIAAPTGRGAGRVGARARDGRLDPRPVAVDPGALPAPVHLLRDRARRGRPRDDVARALRPARREGRRDAGRRRGGRVGRSRERHRAREFLAFLRVLDDQVPEDLDVHIVLDNYATHKTPAVKRWLKKRPRFHIHFTPTHASWLNQVERWFGLLTERQIRRGSHMSVHALKAAIMQFIEVSNETPKPFKWTATADDILARIARFAKRTLKAHEAHSTSAGNH